ncbi:MAG: methylthioribose-1-phosphate isomerase [Pseudohongiella sp.]|nr:MAG: methylthioribose-1-phosphate isomerase [Pseudohongiella sp.]
MNVNGQHFQSIWFDEADGSVNIIDQTRLPHRFEIVSLKTLADACHAIKSMQVRGAPLIGVTAAYGVYLALLEDANQLAVALDKLAATRPTAVNLRWALDKVNASLRNTLVDKRVDVALQQARSMEAEDSEICANIGAHGASLLQEIWDAKSDKSKPLNVLTHCNAGALATVDWGTALSVIYKADEAGIPLHVWVDETRPRNQGASLTCWELAQQAIPHTLIVDNAGGHLMQQGLVDCCVVGSDRTTITGDVCNKIGTYLKALAAFDNDVPFFVALPVSSIDFSLSDGVKEIPIEERDAREVSHLSGIDKDGQLSEIRLCPEGSAVSNYGFDVTPARLVTKIITERGVFAAEQSQLQRLRT